jgi:hypothetical protein
MQKKLKDRKAPSMTFSSHELFFGKFVIDTNLSKQFARHNCPHFFWCTQFGRHNLPHILFVCLILWTKKLPTFCLFTQFSKRKLLTFHVCNMANKIGPLINSSQISS